jgi:hypothetical protein
MTHVVFDILDRCYDELDGTLNSLKCIIQEIFALHWHKDRQDIFSLSAFTLENKDVLRKIAIVTKKGDIQVVTDRVYAKILTILMLSKSLNNWKCEIKAKEEDLHSQQISLKFGMLYVEDFVVLPQSWVSRIS